MPRIFSLPLHQPPALDEIFSPSPNLFFIFSFRKGEGPHLHHECQALQPLWLSCTGGKALLRGPLGRKISGEMVGGRREKGENPLNVLQESQMLGNEQAVEGRRKKSRDTMTERDGGRRKGFSYGTQPGPCTLTPCCNILYFRLTDIKQHSRPLSRPMEKQDRAHVRLCLPHRVPFPLLEPHLGLWLWTGNP